MSDDFMSRLFPNEFPPTKGENWCDVVLIFDLDVDGEIIEAILPLDVKDVEVDSLMHLALRNNMSISITKRP